MENFESILSKAISICNGEAKYREKYFQIYTFPTENVSGYLEYFDLKGKSLLTVGSSFSQVIGAYQCGCRDITLYDINPFSNFYGYLLVASFLSFNYKEFQEFFFKRGLKDYYNKQMFQKEAFEKLKSTLRLLDYASYLFWDELFFLFPANEIRENLFDDDECRNEVIKNFTTYLKDEDSYEQLKRIIRNMSWTFINADLFHDEIPKKYHNIFLSNLYKSATIEEFKLLVEKLDQNYLEKDGSILLTYLWNTNFNELEYKDDWLEMYKLPIVKETLKEYITEYRQITGYHDILWERDEKEDLVLIYRKK